MQMRVAWFVDVARGYDECFAFSSKVLDNLFGHLELLRGIGVGWQRYDRLVEQPGPRIYTLLLGPFFELCSAKFEERLPVTLIHLDRRGDTIGPINQSAIAFIVDSLLSGDVTQIGQRFFDAFDPRYVSHGAWIG